MLHVEERTTLNLFDARFGHLPFVVVSAIAATGAWLIFAFQVYSQVFYCVVSFVSVFMVYAFIRSERSAKMFGHVPAVLKDVVRAASHCLKHRCVFDGNRARRDYDIPCFYKSFLAAFCAFCNSCLCARKCVAAWFASSDIVRIFNLHSQSSERVPSLGTAIRTGNRHGHTSMVVYDSCFHSSHVYSRRNTIKVESY